MSEEWKTIADGFYEVSDQGRVRRLAARPGVFLKSAETGIVHFSYHGKTRGATVGRLVAESFLGPCPFGHHLRYRDGNRLNATVTNLEWSAPVQREPKPRYVKTVISQKNVENIRAARKDGYSYQAIADAFHTSRQHAWNICNGKCRSINWDPNSS